MSAAKTADRKSAAQLLEEQKRRYDSLVARRNKVEAELGAAARQLAEAEAEAVRGFATSDLTELRALYTKIEAENDRLVAEFIENLDLAERELVEVEKQLAG